MPTIRTRFRCRSPPSNLTELTIMFQTLIFQYLNKSVKGEVRDFTPPEAFHAVKVQRLGGDKVKPSAEVSGKFPMPIAPLVRSRKTAAGHTVFRSLRVRQTLSLHLLQSVSWVYHQGKPYILLHRMRQ